MKGCKSPPASRRTSIGLTDDSASVQNHALDAGAIVDAGYRSSARVESEATITPLGPMPWQRSPMDVLEAVLQAANIDLATLVVNARLFTAKDSSHGGPAAIGVSRRFRNRCVIGAIIGIIAVWPRSVAAQITHHPESAIGHARACTSDFQRTDGTEGLPELFSAY